MSFPIGRTNFGRLGVLLGLLEVLYMSLTVYTEQQPNQLIYYKWKTAAAALSQSSLLNLIPNLISAENQIGSVLFNMFS